MQAAASTRSSAEGREVPSLVRSGPGGRSRLSRTTTPTVLNAPCSLGMQGLGQIVRDQVDGSLVWEPLPDG